LLCFFEAKHTAITAPYSKVNIKPIGSLMQRAGAPATPPAQAAK
jgi:hypothetical protein